jgi:hypothetical protein
MTFDESLADSTQTNTLILSCLWLLILAVLYRPESLLPDWSTQIAEVRGNLIKGIGSDIGDLLSAISLLVGFTLERSGTKSSKWKFRGKILMGLPILVWILEVRPKTS